MKKHLLSMMTLLLAFVGVARADELTVNDGTATNGYVPVYGFYADAYLKAEYVIPAADLAEMSGSSINGMTFYATQSSVSLSSNFQVYLTEVDFTTLSAFNGVDNAVLVYEGTIGITEGQLNIEFASPYEYGGGNLLVAFYSTTTGNYSTSTWYGVSATGASVQGYSYSSLDAVSPTQRNFLPKTTFNYEAASSCEAPTDLAISEITPHTALFEWFGGTGDFNVEYKKASDTEWIRYATNCGWNCMFLNLDQNTTYQARVQSNCGDGSTSGWRSISFTTLESCPAPTDLTVVELTATSATLTWTPGYEETEWKLVRTTDGGTIEGITDTVYTIQGLTPNVVNSWAVVAVCGEGEESAWSNTVTFEPTDKLVIGSSNSTNQYLPTYTYYCYSMTQQIYTAEEIGMEGMIMSVDFYNASTNDRTRQLDIYMVNTDKAEFASSYDWVIATQADLVFSGEVTFAAQSWTTIELDEAFAHNGESNMALIVDDNTGSYESAINFYAFDAPSQAIRIYSDDTNYQPLAPNYPGTILNQKNQIRLDVEEEDLNFYTVNVTTESEYAGSVSGSGLFVEGRDITITATPTNVASGCYRFLYWTDGNGVNIEDNPYTFTLTEDVEFVAHFEELPIYSPDAIVNPEGTGAWSVANPHHIHFYEGDTIIFNAGPLSDLYYFVNWTDLDGNIISEVPEFSYVLTGDVTFIVNFAPIPVNIVVNPDTLDLGPRPNGAWMRPYTFTLSNLGFPTEIESVETNDDYFTVNMGNLSAPFTLDYNQSVTLGMEWGEGTGVVNADFIVNYEDTEVAFPVTATAYAPVAGDVWETAIEVTEFPYTATLDAANAPYYNNYVMPFPNIPDGYDVVYKLVFDQDTYLNASVLEDATAITNGKVALYPEGFKGVGGPDERNNYTNPLSAITAAPFEALIGDENSTTTATYSPFHTLWNYSLSENLFLASELATAGVTTAEMTSLSWNILSASTTSAQHNISIWMANVSDTELTSTSHTVNDMTLVYNGSNVVPAVGWNEFVFNEGTFAWDGVSNILIVCQRNNGSYQGSINWQTHNPGFAGMSYNYNDYNAYDAMTTSYSMYTSSTNRPNTIMRAGQTRAEIGGNRDIVEIGDGTGTTYMTPFNSLYVYSFTEQLFFADEIGTAGTINSISFKMRESDAAQTNDIDIFMKNVSRTEFTSNTDYEPVTSSDKVFSGTVTFSPGWTTITLDTPFQYDGTSNLMVAMHEYTSGYSTRYFFCTTVNNSGISYYSDWNNPDPYDLDSYSGSKVLRSNRSNIQLDITAGGNVGPEITDMTVIPGTYYLVASATTENFTVNIETGAVPCPEPATLVAPENYYTSVNPYTAQLKWKLDERATEYALRFGTDPDNLETLVDWTRDLAQSYTLHNLNYHTPYYWQVCERNDGCPNGVEGPVWMFSTEINGPTDLYSINGYEIMEGDVLQLTWTAPAETTRSFMYYTVEGWYWDANSERVEVVNVNTNDTYYEVEGLEYINDITDYPYYFTVWAVYDIGLGIPYAGRSNIINIYVMTTGEVEGNVYEQDGETGIANAVVTVFGYDEFGYYQNYSFTANEEGHFAGLMPLGNSYSAMATANGYQEGWYDGDVVVALNDTLVNPINIILDEMFYPTWDVTAEYYPDANAYDGNAVKVSWADENWHSYCEYEFNNAWRHNSGTTTWGYYYPAEVLAPYVGYSLDKVALFSDNMYNAVGGDYTCNIYEGGATPAEGTLVSSIYVYVPQGLNNWVTYALETPVEVSENTESLWVIWTAYSSLGGYPAGCCDGNNENGDWWYDYYEGNWMHQSGYCWTMRNHFGDGNGRSVVLGNNMKPNTANMTADNAPARIANNGEPASCVNANAPRIPLRQPDRSFQYYRVYRTAYDNYDELTDQNAVLVADNVTDHSIIDETFGDLPMGTYKYGVSCVYEGNRESRITWLNTRFDSPEESSKINSTLGGNRDENLFEDFEAGVIPDGWTLIDADGDGYNWMLGSDVGNITGYDGSSNLILSQSYNNSVGALSPDNYLVTPLVNLGATFSFWACGQDASYVAEHFGVAVSTTSNTDPSTFTTVQEWTMSAKGQGAATEVTRSGNRTQGTWYEYTVDLSAYAGQSGYIAIRHFDCYDMFYLDVDNITYGTPAQPLQLDRESAVAWSNPIDRDMYLYNDVDITVTLNSGDSPEGVYVAFEQYGEQSQLNPLNNTLSFYMDETGYHAWDVFRKGYYNVYIWKDGYQYIYEGVEITEETHLVYELEEIMEGVNNLYVSRTGWASWNGLGNDAPNLINHHYGAALFADFENGMPEGWTTLDADGDGYDWVLGSNSQGIYHHEGISLVGSGHDASDDMMCSGSWSNPAGIALYPDNYLITPQMALGGTFSFWACAQDINYAAEHFGVAVSTTGTEASDFTMLNEWTMTAKGQGAKTEATRSGSRSQGAWYQYTVDLSEFAGQTGYIAIRHFDCYDMFILNVDDVELTDGDAATRHYVESQVTLATLNGDTLYMGTTENDYMQLPTDLLEEGQVYKVSVSQNYSSGLTSEVATCRWYYEPCDNLEGAIDLTGVTDTTGVVISWTYPEVNNDTIEPTRKGNGNRAAWDLMMTFTAPEAGHYGVAYDGTNFYTSNWGYSSAAYNFYKYDLEGNMIEGFNIDGCGTLRGMTYDGQYFYGVANSSTIYCVDLANHTLINTFESEYGTMRGITYDPQRDGFWVIGNWSGNLTLIDRNGAIQFVGPAPESASDLAYYMDEDGVEHVFCFNNSDQGVYDYNITTNTLEGSVFNFSNVPGYGDGASSGGCTVGEYDGKVAFIGDIQQNPNLIGVYELREAAIPEPSPIGEPIGAAIFRNGEWIAFVADAMYIDEDGSEADNYEVRIVYGGAKQCPYSNAYFSMSCPQTVLFPHVITATANPTEGGTVAGAGTYNYGETCTLVATPAENYAFANWTLGGEVVSNSPTYTFTVTEDAALVANFELTTITQTTNLTQGWNWWSTNVEANDLFDQLKTGLGANAQQIKSSTSFVNYYSGYWVGGLSNINNESCYLINNNNACTLEMTGMPALPANHPITINPNWNWIGYPNQGAQSVASAFSNFNPVTGDQVKSQNAFSTYYSGIWVGGLQNITPGMGLLYKSNNTETTTLIYPEVSRSEEWGENVTADNNHWVPDMHAYPNNMTVIAVVELDDEELNGENYELAAFANGECRGSARLMYVAPLNRHMAFLTVTGDEAAELSFSLYDSMTGMEYFESNDALTYTTDATVGSLDEPLVVSFRGTTGLSDIESNLHVYPNPVKAGECFSIALPASSRVERVEIVNVLGAAVSVETSTKAPASILAPNTPGVYTLRVTVENKGSYSKKLVVK